MARARIPNGGDLHRDFGEDGCWGFGVSKHGTGESAYLEQMPQLADVGVVFFKKRSRMRGGIEAGAASDLPDFPFITLSARLAMGGVRISQRGLGE